MTNTLPRVEIHAHSHYSNLRLLDCIIRPESLVQEAINQGLAGIAITDHEALCSHIDMNEIQQKLVSDGSSFKVILGNEIYLVDYRASGIKYYHFILLAKDKIGHKQLQELSSTAWYYGYNDRGMERVPTEKRELKEIIKKNPGHVIGTTACLGGELSTLLLKKKNADLEEQMAIDKEVELFVGEMLSIFGDDFYLEIAPGKSKEQVFVNKEIVKLADKFKIKVVIGTDAHYLKKEDRYVHKSYLNSQDGEGNREVDAFYEYAYLQPEEDIKDNLLSLSELYETFCANSIEIYNKIEVYSLFNKQDIPSVQVPYFEKDENANKKYLNRGYEHLAKLFISDDVQDRYWVNECCQKIKDFGLSDKPEYYEELNEEARVKAIVGEKLETNMFRYPNTFQHYIDMMWECDSLVAPGRGSSCSALNHYLMGITQLDPLVYKFPFFRYMNEERVEIGDIDIDVCPSKRPLILEKIRQERNSMLKTDIEWAKKNLGCTLIATFGTEGTKSAILSAARGYRSKDYPEGLLPEDALYMSSLIPVERGFLWPIDDVVNGNEEKGRKKVQSFIDKVSEYPGLLDIIKNIEGLINHRGSHASGVIFFEDDPFEKTAFMKTPTGEITTQYELHALEKAGLTKYDILVTDAQDKIAQTIKFLQKAGKIEQGSLREIYNKYIHPDKLPLEDQRIWKALKNLEVMDTFQFDSLVGSQAAQQLQPNNIQELTDANGLMRLMGKDGEERPMDKYARYKKNIQLWYDEMDGFGLSKEDQHTIEPYFKPSYGVPPSQEQLMKMLMDENICNFSLAEANAARKIVGKKQMAKIPALKQNVYDKAKNKRLGSYVWKYGVEPQLGYSFSVIHSTAYSFIAVQILYLATFFPPIYWNSACLVVNSGSLINNTQEEIVSIYAPESSEMSNGVTYEDLPDRSGKKKKTASTDYTKVAKALGKIIDAGIKVSLVDINNSDFGFTPDEQNNQIWFGLKGMLNVSDDLIYKIIANRPYSSPKEFIKKVSPNKQAMMALIKGGAFDSMMDRKELLAWYIWETCDKKSRINLQNMEGLRKNDLLPLDTEELKEAYHFYEFNRYLKANCKSGDIYLLDERGLNFLFKHELESFVSENCITQKTWDKIYQKSMDPFRNYFSEHQQEMLQNMNDIAFSVDWNKYAKTANPSAWEMEILCFYYHDHEMKNVNFERYGISDFFKMPEEPIIDTVYKRGLKNITLYKLSKIAGTCIAKNKSKGIVTILTTSGVVDIKFSKEYFSMFDKQISVKMPDGTKKVVETSWFNRGGMIIVNGIRQGNMFVAKKYAKTEGHQLYKIKEVCKDNSLVLQGERYQGGIEEDV